MFRQWVQHIRVDAHDQDTGRHRPQGFGERSPATRQVMGVDLLGQLHVRHRVEALQNLLPLQCEHS